MEGMPVITGDAIIFDCIDDCINPYVPSVPENRANSDRTSDQELHSLLTGNYIRNGIKMKQDTWQPVTDKWSRPSDKDGIFLGQYG